MFPTVFQNFILSMLQSFDKEILHKKNCISEFKNKEMESSFSQLPVSVN